MYLFQVMNQNHFLNVRNDEKKPIENDTNSFDCPCCKYDLKTDAGNPFGDYFLRHCDNCGQMIDWSDEENDD